MKDSDMALDWEDAFNALTDPISIQDLNNKLIRVNKAFADAFGIEASEAAGKSCFSIVHGSRECISGCPHQKTIRSRKTEVIESYDPRLDKYIEITTSPLFDVNGDMHRILHIVKDITARRKAEKLKDDLVSTVSHELRTPLTTIREAVSQVLDGLLGDTTPEQREFLSICLQDVDRLMRIINDLLDISKIEAKRVELQKQTVDMVSLIKQVQSTFVPRFREKNIAGKVSFSNETIEAFADRDKMIQVLTNLVGNALKFTEQGFVEISVVDKGDIVECAVADSGKGISESDLPKVFEKFKQLGRQYGPGEKGTGLGLAISKGIIELHNGKIWVESGQGKGTVFKFTLPKQTTSETIVVESLERLIQFAKKERKECTAFLVSFSDFESFEQKHGKEIMDKLLGEVFARFKQIIGFAQPILLKNKRQLVLLSDVGAAEAGSWKEKVKRLVKGVVFNIPEIEDVDFSCGYAVYPQDGESAVLLFEKAQVSLVGVQHEQSLKNVLVVDDDEAVRSLLADTLRSFGYLNVITVNDGNEALAQIKKHIPDMIILDMQMPNMNGYEVIGHLKENMSTKDIPIMIMSGKPVAFERLTEYVSKKAIPVIGKPVDLKQLKKLLWLLA